MGPSFPKKGGSKGEWGVWPSTGSQGSQYLLPRALFKPCAWDIPGDMLMSNAVPGGQITYPDSDDLTLALTPPWFRCPLLEA